MPKFILKTYFADEDVKWSTKKATEQQITTLNDEIESLKTEKKKMRTIIDGREAEILSKDKDIDNLERETKSLIKSNTNLEAKLKELQSQFNNTSALAADGEKNLKEKATMISNLQVSTNSFYNYFIVQAQIGNIYYCFLQPIRSI